VKILIVGSMSHLASGAERHSFKIACKEIGKALAEAEHTIIVGSNLENTAERHVVNGANTVTGPHRVVQITPYEAELFPRDNFKNIIFEFFPPSKDSWVIGRVDQILAADGVIVIGGGRKTLQAGLTAPILERPILPIPLFGGAAKELWDQIVSDYKKLGGLAANAQNLQGQWQSSFADLSVKSMEDLVKRNPHRSDSRTPQIILSLLVLGLLAAWVSLFIWSPEPKNLTFFVMLGISALLGTGLRTSLQSINNVAHRISWIQILSETTAGLLLAFGLFLVYVVGGFTATGKWEFVKLADNNDFLRVAITMSILGFAAGFLIERASERLSKWFGEILAP